MLLLIKVLFYFILGYNVLMIYVLSRWWYDWIDEIVFFGVFFLWSWNKIVSWNILLMYFIYLFYIFILLGKVLVYDFYLFIYMYVKLKVISLGVCNFKN